MRDQNVSVRLRAMTLSNACLVESSDAEILTALVVRALELMRIRRLPAEQGIFTSPSIAFQKADSFKNTENSGSYTVAPRLHYYSAWAGIHSFQDHADIH
jgi:hypothetical protein